MGHFNWHPEVEKDLSQLDLRKLERGYTLWQPGK